MNTVTWNDNTCNRHGDPYDEYIEKPYKHVSQGSMTCMTVIYKHEMQACVTVICKHELQACVTVICKYEMQACVAWVCKHEMK